MKTMQDLNIKELVEGIRKEFPEETKKFKFTSFEKDYNFIRRVTTTHLKELKDVISFVGHDGGGYDDKSNHPDKKRGFKLSEINKYLASHNVTLGAIGANTETLSVNFYKDYTHITIDINLKMPALVLVESALGNCNHCLYFDSEYFFDPYIGKVDLKDYEVMEWWPVLRFDNDDV